MRIKFKNYLRLTKIICDELTKKSLGIKRSSMPQISDIENFKKFLSENNIKFIEEQIDPTSLRPAQRHINTEKVVNLLKKESQKDIIVSRDLYVIDGTHRWAVSVIKLEPINCVRVLMDSKELIDFIFENYNKVFTKTLN